MSQERPDEFAGDSEFSINYETLPNVEDATITDYRGIRHQAAVVQPLQKSEDNERIPAALVIGGIPRGAENSKKEELFSDTFGRYTQGLASRGVVSLVMNPAGMGNSEGNTFDESLDSIMKSWVSAAEWLVENTTADPARIRIIGNSMGGHIGLRLIDELDKRGITVDRTVLTSPYFYPKISEKAKFGPRFTVAHRLVRDYAKSPAVSALKKYKGKLLVSFSKQDTPIKDEMKDIANAELEKAIEEERGLGYGLQFVRHNYRVADGSAQAAKDREVTLDQASDQIVNFLSDKQ